MSKRGSTSKTKIKELLDERRKIEQWLERLSMAADKTAEAVRDKVKGDYQKRLDAVVEELKGYGDEIRGSLDTYQSKHDGLKSKEQAASDELAEAELRHAVGEFDEGDWASKKGGILETLVQVREELGDVEDEIAELQGVLDALEAPTPAPAEPEPEPAPQPKRAKKAPEPEPDIELEPEPSLPDPRLSLGAELGLRDLGLGDEGDDDEPAPTPEPEPAAAKRESGDELAFLKSVTEDDRQGPEASRASGTMQAIPDGALPSEKGAKNPDVDMGADDVEVLAEQRSVGESRPSSTNQRTLKCGECGAMNFPTEWYCDRCGAELASL